MQFEAEGKKIKFDSPDVIDAGQLEMFDYEFAGQDISIVTLTEEFTSVCPYSGLPDFATLNIEYVPNKKVIELRSLKYYLMTYRNVGIFYEHLINRLLNDLSQACEPKSMFVSLDFTPRGGLETSVSAKFPR